MADYFKIAKLEKPAWLRQYLDEANVFILGKEYRIGEIVEKAVDWLLEVINLVAESVVGGLNVLWSRIDALDTDLNTGINSAFSGISILGSRLNVLEGKLSRLFENNKDLVKGWVSYWTQPTRDLLLLLVEKVNKVEDDLESFKRGILSPTAIIEAIGGAIYDVVSPFKKSREDTKNFFEWLWLFFDDPPKFLYEMADELIDRFW